MRAILDTSVLVDDAFGFSEFELAVSSLSWAELEFGVRKARSPIDAALRQARVQRLQRLFGEGVPFDDEASVAYGTICGLVLAAGRQVRGRAIDLMIAAVAAANDAVVVTRNPRDFAGLEGFVQVIDAGAYDS